ncbi:MAG TPA: AgmX/PglI C-terminal domain-containing protein [Kofleriaceae bacterium]|nr:AgmX/PglI C-terminal domain-containing protein [Kofleriaceae bacterium]
MKTGIVVFGALWIIAALGPSVRAEPEPTPKEQVEKVVQDHMTDFRECYTKRAKVKTTLAGKLVVLITIEEKGNVSDAKVTQSLDDEVDACVAKTMKGLTFPAPGQQVKMKYPFDFHK